MTGDLNLASQQHIVDSIVGNRIELAADVVKSCHHGSGDCSFDFLQRVKAAATIVSSGDDETHAYPRQTIVSASRATEYKQVEDNKIATPLVFTRLGILLLMLK